MTFVFNLVLLLFATTALADGLKTPGAASASAVSSAEIHVRWTDTNGAETAYLIERSNLSSGSFVQVGSVAANAVSFSNIGLNPSTRYYYRVRATGRGKNGVTIYSPYSVVVNATTQAPPQPAPVVSLSASPASIVRGNASTLSWSSQNASSCTASGDASFSGSRAVNGSASVSPTATTQYVISCTGAGGSASSAATVTVTVPPPVPVVSLSASPASIVRGSSSTLSWTSQNASSCTASGDASFSGSRAVNGSASVSPTATTQYSISCTGAGGSASSSATVTVTAQQPAPVVSLSASPASIVSGSSSTLSWTSQNATSCTASGDASFNGSRALNGSASVSPAATTQYSINCVGAGGNASSSATVSVSSNPPTSGLKAFPTAEGFGKQARGGRGGSIYLVTNVNDSGAGSLRECMMASGPRTCIFRVSGTIVLRTQIKPTSGYLTVAGQTAPGGGITIRNDPSNLTGSPFHLNAPHNIIRHVRIRPGPTSGAKQDTTDSITVDAGATDTIIDHVSLSWATDELFNSTKASARVTLQHSLAYEGLSHSTHIQGEHSKGVFAEGKNITLYRNLIAHAMDRMPNAGVGTRIDVVNNVIYNPGSAAGMYFSMLQKQSDPNSGLFREANIIGNWMARGPSSRGVIYGADYYLDYSNNPGKVSIYLWGNLGGGRTSMSEDERNFLSPEDWRYAATAPIGAADIPPYLAASAAMDQVLNNSGAFPRDSADARVVASVRNGTGAIIDSPAEVGGWPTMASGTPYVDADGDGMSDSWEAANGITDPRADKDGDGYTNLEEFLNSLVGE